MKNQPKFGAAIPKDQWIQHTINYDPHPNVPWAHYGPQPMSRWQKLAWVLYVVAILSIIVFWAPPSKADMLLQQGPTWQQMEDQRVRQEIMIQQQHQMLEQQRRQQDSRQPIYVHQPPDYGAIIKRGLQQYEENQK
jgi:hypothetical protein